MEGDPNNWDKYIFFSLAPTFTTISRMQGVLNAVKGSTA